MVRDSDASNPHAEALGRVVIQQQSLEVYLSLYAWCLIAAGSEVGQAVTAPLSFRLLCNLFLELAAIRILDQKLVGRIGEVITRIRQLEQRRNTFIHSVYTQPDEAGHVYRLKMSKRPSTTKSPSAPSQDVPQSDDEIRALAVEIGEARDVLSGLMMEAHTAGYISLPLASDG
jgi:hypothetical protein